MRLRASAPELAACKDTSNYKLEEEAPKKRGCGAFKLRASQAECSL